MLEFKNVTLESAEILRPYLESSINRLCDFSVGGIVMWRNALHTQYALHDGVLYIKFNLQGGRTAFTVPLGKPFRETYKNLVEYCNSNWEKLVFAIVSADEKDEILNFFPEAEVSYERDYSDYIYVGENLATFKGKKYSGQRNHVNRFMRENDTWNFEEVSEANIHEIKAYFEKYNRENEKESFTAVAERNGVREVLDNLGAYGFKGEALRVNGEIIGFFLCEAIYDTLIVHVEKCERGVNGAYQMLAREEAAKYCVGGLKYVNREDDSGDEGLRKSKLSYHPAFMGDKYTVTV
ncbi:MAG: DUF2156 domain-containing protein [Clostridia bacterium]|nr:DUF2156 domain-containing protein [Clostridia bacterium]